MAGLLAALAPASAEADGCTLSSTTETCSGDLSSGVTVDNSDGDFTTLQFQDLTATAGAISITSDPGSGSGTGADGNDVTGVTITFDGSSEYGISDDSSAAFLVDFTAGDGKAAASADHEADDGGTGGSVDGTTSVTITNATDFSGLYGLDISVVAGDGGTGGLAVTTSTESAHAGDGGAGGDSADITVTIESGDLTSLTGTAGEALYVHTEAGDGGDGGEAEGNDIDATNRDGGDGGIGGDAGDVTVNVTTTLSSSVSTDQIAAVRVESIGGDGGDGGEAKGSGDSIKTVGGDGAAAGAGGNVSVSVQTVDFETTSDLSMGLLARSYGGTGGDGGSASGGDTGGSGGGAAGGTAGTVTATFGGTIKTFGVDSTGVLLQSVGGFAGDAGSDSDAVATYGASSESGGASSNVTGTLVSGTSITTTAQGADGIYAQSVGGGGGKGASSTGLTSLGGSGSAGGDGANASVTLEEGVTILTSGDTASAVYVQSFGGGGGSGGSADGITAIGGSGGTGGSAGTVTASVTTATLTTVGDSSNAIFLSSSGGGGGVAKSTAGIKSIGGSGGDGGDGGTATLTLDSSTIMTSGDDANAIFVQSVGGGGGSGANSLAVGIEFAQSVGGSGGDGGSGASVEIKAATTDTGTIVTEGERARGVVLQSIGGGGGDSGNSYSMSIGALMNTSIGQTEDGGDGNVAGDVTIDAFYHSVETSGDHAHGVLAQSVGGGGGSVGTTLNIDAVIGAGANYTSTTGGAGGTGGDGGMVTITLNEAISTMGDQAHAVFAQSVGGGGGNSGSTISGSVVSFENLGMTSGGSGGAGGDGAAVSVTTEGDITTTGAASYGVFAQSTGGGGGNAGWTSNIDGVTVANLTLTSGGSGGEGGTADDVTVMTASGTTIEVDGDGSMGVLAQSVGGGGGNAYATVAGSLSSSVNLSIASGGDGGAAGDSGIVKVTNAADIITKGASGYGIVAQSIPNSGGNASFTVDASALSAVSLSASASGSGGTGGTGGDVTVTNSGTITTSGDYAIGIIAQSNGSGGGSTSGAISVDALTMDSISVAIGGNGGTGGTGGDVSVTSSAEIQTSGSEASGILAQSLGGDGGTGGMVINAGINASSEVSADGSVSIGGGGGSGANGGMVTVKNTGKISTADYESYGIYAQSLGGSGGKGGSVYAGELTFSSGKSASATIAIGGSGGTGGGASTVQVTNEADIDTGANGGSAIFAQSVGGSGGTGGSAYALTGDSSTSGTISLDISVGGDGGGSSTAGMVTVENTATLSTTVSSSAGIYAQSIGGNGGTAGNALTVMLDNTTGTSGTLTLTGSIEVGGSGGTGGVAAEVDVTNKGTIETVGDSAPGIFAQSIGGNGGDGGSASQYSLVEIAKSTSSTSNGSFSLDIAIGGSGGTGADADEVQITNTGKISTEGVASYGIFAQSVGGGGGTGGSAGSNSISWVTLLDEALAAGEAADAQAGFDALDTPDYIIDQLYDYYSELSTLSDLSADSFLTSWDFIVGGSGGSSGTGALVYVLNEKEITTTGDSGTAIYAQSVGGGGGTGGDGFGFVTTTATVSGDAGSGSDGGDVTVSSTHALSTSGFGAMGIFAQSVGGGGGVAGDAELASIGFTSDSFGLGVVDSGSGGDGGNGGDVTVTSSSTITTTGEAAHGIWAQSVGGGGGAAGSYGADVEAIIGSGGDAGDGGDVKITVSDTISVTGDYSMGIFAQSVSGDDGSSKSGDVNLVLKGDITVGDYGQGVVVQSEGSGSSGSIEVELYSGYTISVGESSSDGDGSYGILVLDGDGDVELKIYGDIIMSSVDDVAIGSLNTLDSTTIRQTETIFGSIDMTQYTEMYIKNGGVLEIGTLFKLGDETEGGVLYLDEGTVSPGGEDNIITTEFYGELTTESSSGQSNEGIFLFDLEMGESESDGTSDVIAFMNTKIVDDDSTVFKPHGTVEPNLTGTNLLSTGDSGSVAIFTANSTENTFSLSNLSVEDSSTVDYELSVGTEDSKENVTLTYTVDYSPDSADLSDNQESVGDYVSNLTDTVGGTSSSANSASASASDGSIALTVEGAPAAAAAVEDSSTAFVKSLTNHLLTVQSNAELQQIYDLLGPGEIFATAQTTVLSSLRFDDKLHSCAQIGAEGVALYFDEGSCVWSDFYGVYNTRGEEPNTASYDETVFGFAFGGQQRLEDGWILGAAVSYEHSNLNATDYSGEGHRVQAGAVVKKELGATTLSGSFSGGFGTYDATRTLFSPNSNTPTQADSDPSNIWIAAHGRVAHAIEITPAIELEPYLDMGVWQFWQGAYDEGGGDPYALDIDGFAKTSVTANPMLEARSTFEVFDVAMNANARAGVLAFLTSRDISTNARLQGAGTAGPWFTLQDTDNRVYGQVGASLQGQLGSRFTLEGSFDSLLGDNSSEYVGAATLRFHF